MRAKLKGNPDLSSDICDFLHGPRSVMPIGELTKGSRARRSPEHGSLSDVRECETRAQTVGIQVCPIPVGSARIINFQNLIKLTSLKSGGALYSQNIFMITNGNYGSNTRELTLFGIYFSLKIKIVNFFTYYTIRRNKLNIV